MQVKGFSSRDSLRTQRLRLSVSCPRPWPLFPEALALLKAGQNPRRSAGAELPRGAQMGKLGPSLAIQQPFCLAAKQPASASLPLTFQALPAPPPPNQGGENGEFLSHPAFLLYLGWGGG